MMVSRDDEWVVGFMAVGGLVGSFTGSDRGEEFVPAAAGHVEVAGLQGNADAFGGVVRFVKREVTPPGSPVVPEVMVGILFVDPDRQLAGHALGVGLFPGGNAGRQFEDVFVAHFVMQLVV